MPLEFVNLVKGYHPPTTDDRGFLFSLSRQVKWNNSATTEAINLLRNFAEPYHRIKCPEEYQEKAAGESEEGETKEVKSNGSSDTRATKKSYCIQFTIRQITNTNMFCFLACNLADPTDFAHFMFRKMCESRGEVVRLPEQPFTIIPIQRICAVQAETIERILQPLVQQVMAKDPDYSYRFAALYHSRTGPVKELNQTETLRLVRNCVWAANPNCVQCIKNQDFAVAIEILDPYCYLGVLQDFDRLRDYSTSNIGNGPKEKAAGPDSEDDISDDPLLDEDTDLERKLRIKRKRWADKQAEDEREKKKLAEDNSSEVTETQEVQDNSS